jgi:hypothetical protein
MTDEPDTLPSWAIDAIQEELNKAKHPSGIRDNGSHPRLDGYIQALKWMLTLRKPEEK